MANSSTEAKSNCHTRSVSFPSRVHPQTAILEDQLSTIRSSSKASTCSSSICQNLGLLNDLYLSFDDVLPLPHAQQALSQCQQVEKSLDGSVRLLDICSMSKDALLIMKESLQKLESSLRRRSGESARADEVQDFQVSRKNIKRIVSKCSKTLSNMESCKVKLENRGRNPEHVVLLELLEEVEAVSLPILRSILSFMSSTKPKSLLSKLMSTKQTGKQGEVMEKLVDQVLEALKGKKTERVELHSIKLISQELEEGLDCLFRRLLKFRVSLLNILNH